MRSRKEHSHERDGPTLQEAAEERWKFCHCSFRPLDSLTEISQRATVACFMRFSSLKKGLLTTRQDSGYIWKSNAKILRLVYTACTTCGLQPKKNGFDEVMEVQLGKHNNRIIISF